MAEHELSAELKDVMMAFNQARSKWAKGADPHVPMFKTGEADVVAFIHRYSDDCHGVNPSQIGDHLGMSRPAVTAILNSLQEKDCIERRLSTADRRMIEIFLTPESRQKVDEMICHMDSHIKRIVSELGEEDTIQLVRLLAKVVEIVASGDCPCQSSKKKK